MYINIWKSIKLVVAIKMIQFAVSMKSDGSFSSDWATFTQSMVALLVASALAVSSLKGILTIKNRKDK